MSTASRSLKTAVRPAELPKENQQPQPPHPAHNRQGPSAYKHFLSPPKIVFGQAIFIHRRKSICLTGINHHCNVILLVNRVAEFQNRIIDPDEEGGPSMKLACSTAGKISSAIGQKRRRTMKFHAKNLAVIALCFGLTSVCHAQNAPASPAPDQQKPADQAAPPPAAPAAPAALPTPSITGPLAGNPSGHLRRRTFWQARRERHSHWLRHVAGQPRPG